MQKQDIAEINEIEKLAQIMAKAINPKKIYLFGSFARGEQKESSDYDFYIVVDDEDNSLCELNGRVETAVGFKRKRPLDILVVSEGYFNDKLRDNWPVEQQVKREGVLLYERIGKKMA